MRSQRPLRRSGGREAMAQGWIGSPDSRATISTPGFATRYGPNGPSQLTTSMCPERPSGGHLAGHGGGLGARAAALVRQRHHPCAERAQHRVHHDPAEATRAERHRPCGCARSLYAVMAPTRFDSCQMAKMTGSWLIGPPENAGGVAHQPDVAGQASAEERAPARRTASAPRRRWSAPWSTARSSAQRYWSPALRAISSSTGLISSARSRAQTSSASGVSTMITSSRPTVTTSRSPPCTRTRFEPRSRCSPEATRLSPLWDERASSRADHEPMSLQPAVERHHRHPALGSRPLGDAGVDLDGRDRLQQVAHVAHPARASGAGPRPRRARRPAQAGTAPPPAGRRTPARRRCPRSTGSRPRPGTSPRRSASGFSTKRSTSAVVTASCRRSPTLM